MQGAPPLVLVGVTGGVAADQPASTPSGVTTRGAVGS